MSTFTTTAAPPPPAGGDVTIDDEPAFPPPPCATPPRTPPPHSPAEGGGLVGGIGNAMSAAVNTAANTAAQAKDALGGAVHRAVSPKPQPEPEPQPQPQPQPPPAPPRPGTGREGPNDRNEGAGNAVAGAMLVGAVVGAVAVGAAVATGGGSRRRGWLGCGVWFFALAWGVLLGQGVVTAALQVAALAESDRVAYFTNATSANPDEGTTMHVGSRRVRLCHPPNTTDPSLGGDCVPEERRLFNCPNAGMLVPVGVLYLIAKVVGVGFAVAAVSMLTCMKPDGDKLVETVVLWAWVPYLLAFAFGIATFAAAMSVAKNDSCGLIPRYFPDSPSIGGLALGTCARLLTAIFVIDASTVVAALVWFTVLCCCYHC